MRIGEFMDALNQTTEKHQKSLFFKKKKIYFSKLLNYFESITQKRYYQLLKFHRNQK